MGKAEKGKKEVGVWSRRRWRVVQLGVVVLLVGLFLGGRMGWLPEAAGTDQGRYHDKFFRVVNVVDGDTFDIDVPDGDEAVTRIRLWGVDTPETKDVERGVMHYGPEATAFTREMVLGKQVRVVLEPFEESRGLYGRLLAYVYLEDGIEEHRESRVLSQTKMQARCLRYRGGIGC